MKNVLLLLTGALSAWLLVVACGSAVPSALGDDAGVNDGGPVDITSRFVWVTRTFDCERDIIEWDDDPNQLGFAWPEMAKDSVRALNVIQVDSTGARRLSVDRWEIREGFLFWGTGCTPDWESFIVTLGLELPE